MGCMISRKRAVDRINGHYKNKDCKAYHDYREMMARKDIDAVMLAVPDHWHALTAVEAANNKKDIYGEKPLARTIAEQQAIVNHNEGPALVFAVAGSGKTTVALAVCRHLGRRTVRVDGDERFTESRMTATSFSRTFVLSIAAASRSSFQLLHTIP